VNNQFYQSAPVMKGKPNTEKRAKPQRKTHVTNATVLKVETATYRSAVFSGTFLLDEELTEKLKKNKDGWVTAIVFCLWYGSRLKTRGIEIKYKHETAKKEPNFTGDVDADIYF